METEPTWWQKLLKLDPALVRGFIVATFTLLANVLAIKFGDDQVESIVQFVSILSSLLTAILIKPAVTANARVLAFRPDPFDTATNPEIKAGEATVEETNVNTQAVLDASLSQAA